MTLHSLSSENNSDITTKPNMEEDCQIIWSNREASEDHKSPREPKRWRDAIEPTEVAVEATPAKGRKRKACDEAGTSSKRSTSTNTGEVILVSSDEVWPTNRKRGIKRKARTERQTSSKSPRATSSNTGEVIWVSSDEVWPTNRKRGIKRKARTERQTSSKSPRATSSNTGEVIWVSLDEVWPTNRKRGIKRKASTERQTSSKSPRATSSNTGEVILVSADEVWPTDTEWGINGKASSEKQTSSERPRATGIDTDVAFWQFLDSLNQTKSEENATEWPESYTQHLWSTSFPHNTSKADFEKKYVQLQSLGKGAFGSVYAGYRKSDDLPVAIKHILLEDMETQEIVLNEKTYVIPREVLTMQRAAGGPESVGKSAAVSLIDWFTLKETVVLVIERPVPCKDLETYLKGSLEEQQAKNIMKQLVNAAIELKSKGVLHQDIKLDNILIEIGSIVPRVRIIDFGLSDLVGEIRFSINHDYERELDRSNSITIHQLGLALLDMLSNSGGLGLIIYPRMLIDDFIRNPDIFNVTKECQKFLLLCFQSGSKDDAYLENLRKHPWFDES